VNSKAPLLLMLVSAALGAAVAATTPGTAQTAAQNAQPSSQPASKYPAKHHTEQSGDEGERVFEQNCSRCHNAPEGFSTRISGTIVRHMRVRANLSQHDEQELLKYLNP
jgi:cytochrome c5